MRYLRYLIKQGYLKERDDKEITMSGWEDKSLASLHEYLTKMKKTSASKDN